MGGSAPEQGEQDEQRKYQKKLEGVSVSRQVVGIRICYRLGPQEEGKKPMTNWAALGV